MAKRIGSFIFILVFSSTIIFSAPYENLNIEERARVNEEQFDGRNVFGENFFHLKLEKGKRIRVPDGLDHSISSIGLARLYSTDKNGDVESWMDYYLMSFHHGNSAIIQDRFRGHSAAITFEDVNNDNRAELLVRYHDGASQMILRIYCFSEGNIIPYKNQPVASNMRSIQIKDGMIIVKNQVFEGNDVRLETDCYRLGKEGVELVESKSEIIAKARE